MLKHIEFCLDEIACEIEALEPGVLAASLKAALEGNIASMRAIVGAARGTVAGSSPPSLTAGSISDQGPPATDELTRIRGVSTADMEMLAAHGVALFETIAAWRRADIEALGGGKALRLRIAQENWIEQAAILAAGRSTAFAADFDQCQTPDRSPVLAITAAIAEAMSPGETRRRPQARQDIAA